MPALNAPSRRARRSYLRDLGVVRLIPRAAYSPEITVHIINMTQGSRLVLGLHTNDVKNKLTTTSGVDARVGRTQLIKNTSSADCRCFSFRSEIV